MNLKIKIQINTVLNNSVGISYRKKEIRSPLGFNDSNFRKLVENEYIIIFEFSNSITNSNNSLKWMIFQKIEERKTNENIMLKVSSKIFPLDIDFLIPNAIESVYVSSCPHNFIIVIN